MILLRVDGVELKSPTTYDLKMADIDSSNSGRSESGYMTREVIRRKVTTLNVEFANISTQQHQLILSTVNKDFLQVEFYNGTNELQKATMYTSEIDFKLISAADDLWSVSLQLTEQ